MGYFRTVSVMGEEGGGGGGPAPFQYADLCTGYRFKNGI